MAVQQLESSAQLGSGVRTALRHESAWAGGSWTAPQLELLWRGQLHEQQAVLPTLSQGSSQQLQDNTAKGDLTGASIPCGLWSPKSADGRGVAEESHSPCKSVNYSCGPHCAAARDMGQFSGRPPTWRGKLGRPLGCLTWLQLPPSTLMAG